MGDVELGPIINVQSNLCYNLQKQKTKPTGPIKNFGLNSGVVS